jgi:hypothetical protein
VSAPIDRMLETVKWKALDLTDCSFVGEPDALYATHEGTLEIADARLRCYQLNDGQRVFDADDVAAIFSTQPEEEQG